VTLLAIVLFIIWTFLVTGLIAWQYYDSLQIRKMIEELHDLERNVYDLAQNNYSAIKAIIKKQAQYQKEPPSVKDMLKNGDQELSKQD